MLLSCKSTRMYVIIIVIGVVVIIIIITTTTIISVITIIVIILVINQVISLIVIIAYPIIHDCVLARLVYCIVSSINFGGQSIVQKRIIFEKQVESKKKKNKKLQ